MKGGEWEEASGGVVSLEVLINGFKPLGFTYCLFLRFYQADPTMNF
jgi:hypothetical protein